MSGDSPHPAFPSDETLAAFVDGRLGVETRQRVVEHVADCADCRDVVIFNREFARSERGGEVRPFPMRRAVVIAVAASLVVAVTLGLFFARRRSASEASIADLTEWRPSDARLSGFPFHPVRPVTRGDDHDSDNWRLLAAAERIREAARTHPTAENLHQLGLAYMLLDKPNDAVASLERAVVADAGGSDPDAAVMRSTNAPLLCDLSAAYYERGRKESRPDQFVRALNAADRAWEVAKSPEAAWNRAQALEGLHQDASAARAWRDVLQSESDPSWRKEAARHASAPVPPQSHLGRPDVLRKDVVRKLIPAWAAALGSGDTRMADALMAQAVSAACELRVRDHNDVLVRILKSLRDHEKVVLPLLRQAAATETDESHKNRAAVLAAVSARFRELHSPYAASAAVNAARESFLANDYEGVLAICAAALNDDNAKMDTAAAGELQWLRGLSLLATGSVADAVLAYEAACSSFTAMHEEARTAGALARLAEAQEYAGATTAAWESREQSFLLARTAGDAATLSSNTYAAAIAAAQSRLPYAALELLASIDRSAATLRVDVPLLRASVLRDLGQANRARLNVGVAVAEADGFYSGEAKDRAKANATMTSATITGDPASLSESIAFFARSHNEFSLTQALVRRAELLLARHDRAAAESDYLNAIAIIESQSLQSRDVTIRAELLDTATSSYDAVIEAARSRHNPARCFEYAERARMLPFAATGLRGATVDPQTVAREAIHRQDVVVEYAVLSDRLIVWSFQDGIVAVRERPIARDELSNLIDDGRRFDPAALDRLARILLDGIDLRSARRLVFVPEKELRGVPFAALKAPGTTSFLIRDHALRVVPSATWYCRSPARTANDHAALLAVGDPALNRQAYASLAPLPRARAETLAVASLYQSPTVLLGGDATPQRFVNGLKGATIIHFAGHAVTDVRDPLLSGLVLTPDASAASGTLYARDILGLHLQHAPTVILSACETASGHGYARGVNNVALAFLVAGARSVVAATAPVDDEAAFALLREYHRRLSAGEESPDALRKAQLTILESRNPQLEGVAKWGAFEVIG